METNVEMKVRRKHKSKKEAWCINRAASKSTYCYNLDILFFFFFFFFFFYMSHILMLPHLLFPFLLCTKYVQLTVLYVSWQFSLNIPFITQLFIEHQLGTRNLHPSWNNIAHKHLYILKIEQDHKSSKQTLHPPSSWLLAPGISTVSPESCPSFQLLLLKALLSTQLPQPGQALSHSTLIIQPVISSSLLSPRAPSPLYKTHRERLPWWSNG